MANIILLIISLIYYFGFKYIYNYILDNGKLPNFINYKPFNCYKCFNFWMNNALFLTLSVIFNPIFIVGMAVTVLDTIAIIIDEKQKTVKL